MAAKKPQTRAYLDELSAEIADVIKDRLGARKDGSWTAVSTLRKLGTDLMRERAELRDKLNAAPDTQSDTELAAQLLEAVPLLDDVTFRRLADEVDKRRSGPRVVNG